MDRLYLIVNFSFILIFSLIFAYPAIFSHENDNYPIDCVHKKITGFTCETCGISHSFSAITRGKLKEANALNRNGILLFIFFGLQLLMRALTTFLLLKGNFRINKILRFDLVILFISFMICYRYLIMYWYSVFINLKI